jgi:hypothetical protein
MSIVIDAADATTCSAVSTSERDALDTMTNPDPLSTGCPCTSNAHTFTSDGRTAA